MCTRFSFDVNREKIKRQFNLTFKQDLDRSFNISPTQNAYVLTSNANELIKFRWGLIPYWAKDIDSGNHLSLAMIDGIESKDSFRMPVRYQRCVIFADSYYDKLRKNYKDFNYRIFADNGNILAFAGIWDKWSDKDNKEHFSFSIITINSNNNLKSMGWSRMPAFLNNESEIDIWLNNEIDYKIALNSIKTVSDQNLNYYLVSNAIDNPNNDYSELQKEIVY